MIVGEAEVQGQGQALSYRDGARRGRGGPRRTGAPRRARAASACAARPDASLERVGVVGGGEARRRLPGRPRQPPRVWAGRRRTPSSPLAPCAVGSLFVANSAPTGRWGLLSVTGAGGRSRSTRFRVSSSRPTSSAELDGRSASDRSDARNSSSWPRCGRTPSTSPCRATSSRASGTARDRALRHGRPPGRGRAQPEQPSGRGGRRPSLVRGTLRRLAREPHVVPTHDCGGAATS